MVVRYEVDYSFLVIKAAADEDVYVDRQTTLTCALATLPYGISWHTAVVVSVFVVVAIVLVLIPRILVYFLDSIRLVGVCFAVYCRPVLRTRLFFFCTLLGIHSSIIIRGL